MNTVLVMCAIALFVWAFTEAFAWPVIPDVALASVVFLAPDHAAVLVVATVTGSVIGGVTAMAARRSGWRWPLPLVSEHMQSRVATWLDRGPVGLMHQPLTGVPYKAFVVEGARRGFRALPWAWWTGVFRGARMAVVGATMVLASNVVGHLASPHAAEARIVVLVVGLVLFVIGWRITWLLWIRSESRSPARTAGDTARTMRP